MNDAMAARGPDGEGVWCAKDGSIFLAHRRLAIIDLDDRSAQPMSLPDGSLVVVFNGEIYNYRELRRELEGRGVVFRTESDTEVLLHLYRTVGPAMVERLRGMFAFAIWDVQERCLFLARDPFGIKPLYYADDGRTLRFASQVKALVAGGAVGNSPSAAGIAGFFLWGHVPEPWTWVKSVRALPGGSTLTVRQGARVSVPCSYFDLRNEIIRAEQAPHATTTASLAEAVGAVADSVRHHLVADVPVGVFLSAGRDSSLIATLAARGVHEPLRTFTLGFDEFRNRVEDEVPLAQEVAKVIGARHATARVTRADFEAEYERLLAAMDQPSIDGVNTYFVSRAAAATGLKVVLTGLGGDELFGGYPSFGQVPRLVGALRGLGLVPWLGRALRRLATPLARRLDKPKAAGLLEYGTAVHRAYLLRRALLMPWELPDVMDARLAREGLDELAVEDDLKARIAGIRTPTLAVMALEMSCYMRNQLLRDADWASMAHSLEIRVPLVDVELLRRWLPFAIRCVPFDRQLLIQAVGPDVARIIASRPKTGFGVPVQSWLRNRSSQGRLERTSKNLRPWASVVASQFAGVLG